MILNSNKNIGQQYIVVSIWAVTADTTDTAGAWFYDMFYSFYEHHYQPAIPLPADI